MKVTGIVGAISDDGENLRVVTREDLEALPPGVYSLGETRKFTGRQYAPEFDVWSSHDQDPQELIARIREDARELPEGFGLESAYFRKSDGKGVITAWAFENRVNGYDDPRIESTMDYHKRTGKLNDACSISA